MRPSVTGMRKCPACAEEIQDAAIVCKHCGRDVRAGRLTSKEARVLAWVVGVPIAIFAGWCALTISKVLTGVQARQDYRSKLEVRLDGFARGGDRYTYVKGHVTNTGDRTVRYWKVMARYRDGFISSSPVIDTAYTNALETLRPGERKNFEIMHAQNGAKSVALEVDEVQLE